MLRFIPDERAVVFLPGAISAGVPGMGLQIIFLPED